MANSLHESTKVLLVDQNFTAPCIIVFLCVSACVN